MKKLENKVAVITGGANGIGKSTALLFAEHGATVCIWDLAEEQGVAVADSINGSGGKAVFMKVNTVDNEAVKAAVQDAVDQFGKIDVLINNAGITRDSTLKKMSQADWQAVIDVNLTGVFNCTQEVSLRMLEAGSGVILNASSVVGLYGNFGQTNYVATKAGLIGMTKVWAKELGPKGIRTNAVAPGFIATDMVMAMPENVIKMMEEKAPMKRMGKPEDIANAYLFLASDDASFINGAVLSVDGGLTI